MRFVVDEMPHSANCDCPFAEWKPNPPCFEEIGQYVCKNDNKKCDRNVSECRWMIQMPNKAFLKEQELIKPDYDPATLTWSCGNCGQTFDRCKNKFCHRCGRPVKWDEKEGEMPCLS